MRSQRDTMCRRARGATEPVCAGVDGAARQAGAVRPLRPEAHRDTPSSGPGLHLLSVPRGNLLVRIGAKESFVAGAQRPELVAAARALLASQHAPPVRFALAMASDDAAREGDGGWSAAGAISLAHELARGRMMRARVATLPSMGFSEVVQLGLSGDEAHVVHQPAGYSDADVIVHLEARGSTAARRRLRERRLSRSRSHGGRIVRRVGEDHRHLHAELRPDERAVRPDARRGDEWGGAARVSRHARRGARPRRATRQPVAQRSAT